MQSFDQYGDNYRDVVQRSINFAGLKYDVFVKAKANMIQQLATAKWADPSANAKFLDVGCGVGSLHDLLAGTFAEICGVDVSEKSIEAAKNRNPHFEYKVMRGIAIPYPAATFDMVIAINVMHHVDPALWQSFVLELKRVIRPDGLVSIIEHNPWNPLTRLAVFRCPFDKDAKLLRAGQTRALLEGAGLIRVRSHHFLLSPFFASAAIAVERWLSPVPLGAQYVAVGERALDDRAAPSAATAFTESR